MKILIFGAGVIGSIYASRLYEAHHDVTLLVRSSRYEAIARNGVSIRNTLTKKQTTSFMPCIRELKPTDAFDLVVVTVRLDQIGSVIPALRANQCCPLLLFMLNNPTGTPQLVHELGAKRILLGFPGVGGVYHDGCIDYLQIKQQKTTIGEISGERSTRIKEIKTILGSAHFAVDVNDDMPSWLKTHAVFISCMTAAILKENGDSVQLANNRFAVRQLVVSIREGFNACKIMPCWFSVLYWRHALKGKTGTLAIAPHANAAKDEMRLLAEKVISITRSSPRPTPRLDKLLSGFIQK
jgi:2-dehydropantoate 2-reductase